MIGIVIVAHGGLAKEYLAAVEHVVGKQTAMRAIAIEDDHDRKAKQAEICAAADAVVVASGLTVADRDGDQADYRDDRRRFDLVVETRTVRATDTLPLHLAPGGGQAIRFVALPK
mgnify:CR=1 FL=1